MNQRPELNKNISIQDFKNFYWYKKELVDFCRSENLDQNGGKIELANRIEFYLSTGKRAYGSPKTACVSRFDWNNEKLSTSTLITDSYKNTENVRAFFKEQIGKKFSFNVAFMNWMKSAQGKNLGDAVEMWIKIKNEIKENKFPKDIAPQFEYNTYVRDFLRDNPNKRLSDAIRCWNAKKAMSGDKKYRKKDCGYSIKQTIVENLCYTELVYERVNKKLAINYSHEQIEEFIFELLKNTNEEFFVKSGKNYYVTNSEKAIKLTINSNTYRLITVELIK